MFALLTFIWLMLAPPGALPQQEQKFTPVEGASLQAKQAEAARLASSSQQSRYWTAHAFDVRPGVAVDFEFVGDDGRVTIDGTSYINEWTPGTLKLGDGQVVETRNLAVFALRDATAGGQVVRVEVYNLARRREYSGYPVYWAGRATNEESLGFLRGVVEAARTDDLAGSAVRAIAVHDDRRVTELLERFVRTLTDDNVRAQAVRALGHQPPAPTTRDLLAALARDGGEGLDVRRAAIMSYGRSVGAQSLDFLQSLYGSLTHRELKRAVISSVARNENRVAAGNFLAGVAARDEDKELRKRAVQHLGVIAGDHALGVLRETATREDADTELQKQAAVAVSRRPAAEAVPLLINLARTHPKPEVRRTAFILLGRTGDPAAAEFLKSVLTK